jgi:hypothetical protein
MFQHLDPLCRHPVLHTGSLVNCHVVPAKPPLLLGHGRPLLLEVLQELLQGLIM